MKSNDPSTLPPGSDDRWIDALLRESSDSYISDDGFTRRVMRALPAAPGHRGRSRLRRLTLWSSGLAGILVTLVAVPQDSLALLLGNATLDRVSYTAPASVETLAESMGVSGSEVILALTIAMAGVCVIAGSVLLSRKIFAR